MHYNQINTSAIRENLMDSNELIIQFLSLYQEQIPTDVQALKAAVDSGIHVEIANKAHYIKPTMEYIGAQDLRKKLQQLEYAGKNNTELSSIEVLYQEIEADVQVLLQEIADFRQSL